MLRIIRLTEGQLKHIEETTFDNGIDTPNPIPEIPQGQVAVAGKMETGDDDYSNPVTTGDIANTKAKSFPWGTGSYYRGTHNPMVAEGIDAESDGNIQDGVDKFYNHDISNELIDGDESDDQQIIPHSVEMHLDRLISSMKTLTPKKQMAILNKLIANTDIQSVPPSFKKESSLKILSKK